MGSSQERNKKERRVIFTHSFEEVLGAKKATNRNADSRDGTKNGLPEVGESYPRPEGQENVNRREEKKRPKITWGQMFLFKLEDYPCGDYKIGN